MKIEVNMIRKIQNITPFSRWMRDFICDESFSTPFCDENRVLSVSGRADSLLLGAYAGDTLIGIFCLMVLDREKYIETLFLYTKEKRAYEQLLAYLSDTYRGYEMWFVYNPKNPILTAYLSEKQAFFYKEQRYMEYMGAGGEDTDEVIPYCDLYKESYLRIHSEEGYWDGEKTLEKREDFYIFLCIRNNSLVGYIDLSKGNGTSEVMDIRVLPEYRNQGIGGLLLKKTIFMSIGNPLVLTVDIDNFPAIHLYEKTGFREIPMNNVMTAKLVL